MVQEHTKNRLLMIEAMLAIVLVIFIGAFALDKFWPTPQVPAETGALGVVGFVPLEIKSQPMNLAATESTSFVLFSEKEKQFDLTSFRLSGTVKGEGRAEIVLDNGLGQELLIYSNTKDKKGNLITGMVVTEEGEPLPEDAKIKSVSQGQAWLKMTPEGKAISEVPSTELGDSKTTIQGEFQHRCVDTCYMNMKMQLGLYYTLKVRVDPGTEVIINELMYILEV